MLCYEFLVGRPPFESKTSSETYKLILKVRYDFPPHVSPDARDLISKVSSFLISFTSKHAIRCSAKFCKGLISGNLVSRTLFSFLLALRQWFYDFRCLKCGCIQISAFLHHLCKCILTSAGFYGLFFSSIVEPEKF